jgi:hypothetical protein
MFHLVLCEDSSVGIATGYALDGRGTGVRFPAGVRDFSLLQSCGAHPASYPMSTCALSPGVKRPGREADHPHLVREEHWSLF